MACIDYFLIELITKIVNIGSNFGRVKTIDFDERLGTKNSKVLIKFTPYCKIRS